MYDFILQTSFFLSLGILIYLMARAMPRVGETETSVHPSGRFDKMLSKLPLKEIDERLEIFFEKALRRIKVWILRSDNVINQYLNKLKKNSDSKENQEGKIDLFENLNSEKKE